MGFRVQVSHKTKVIVYLFFEKIYQSPERV